MSTLTACPACGSIVFWVSESYSHQATLLADGTLLYKSGPASGGRDSIACKQCAREFAEEEFRAIDTT
jgi:hypothetical protein